MTNIFAAIIITLVTNVTESDNHSGCSVCDEIARNFYAMYCGCGTRGPYVPATEKYVTTTCTERAECKFEHNGYKWTLPGERVIWQKRQTFKKKDEWVPDGPPQDVICNTPWGPLGATNAIVVPGSGVMLVTNFIGSEVIYTITATNAPACDSITNEPSPYLEWQRKMQPELDRIKAKLDRDLEIMRQREKEGK